jgi:hypothetical protein
MSSKSRSSALMTSAQLLLDTSARRKANRTDGMLSRSDWASRLAAQSVLVMDGAYEVINKFKGYE